MARATAKLTDPEDGPRYLDLDELTLDNAIIDAALDTLVKERPYLSATGAKTPTRIDQGAQGTDVVPQSASDWLRTSLRGS